MAETNDPSFFGENRSLFSDYYIAERLQDHKEWSTDVSEPFQKALELYEANKAGLPKMNESQTEKEFIQPILSDVLGFEYDVQRSEKRSGRLNIPDYIFFRNESSLKEAQAHRDEKGRYYSEALALGDAKYWGRSLDGKGVSEKDRLTNANPSFQIVNYLTATGLDWGILTNGSQWRLYSMKSRSRIDSYFEVNLKRILEEEDEEQFKYFYHFFRAKAFREDPETGQHFLGSVFDGSIDYGTRLEGRLKELIFENVFLTLAKGFTEFRASEARNEEETDQSLQEIYQGTLRLLYRLLFLLHAESRNLLPIDNRDYFQYSLMNLKKDIAERVEKGLTPSSQSFDVWNDLDSLFRIIDQGDPDLNVPRYNGGLFRGDHPKNQFLGNHKISDTYLVPALELLTREPDPKTGRKRFIDYKSLNVEQLGSIYEGLLEFHLRIAEEPLAVVKKRGREVFEPEKEVDNPSQVIKKGELYLENDKGERKATGSYYTPHYIVEYIVEHTLGPVFHKRAETFEELMDRLEPKYGAYSKLNQKIAEGDRSERTHNKRKEVNLEIESLENRATEALLSIKICDPAMGSGHFLKEATDKLAEKIITLLAQYPLNPVTKLLGSVREDILASLDEQDITIDADEHLKDTNLIKRMVMKRSIYGVDLNPMAVELAKLSLWLDSFTVGAPLSFLDHHLKTGNSLIGTTVDEVKFTLELDEDRQIEAFGGPFAGMLTATQLMRDVAQRTDATISEVQQSVETYHDYEEAITPYKRLLDLWISRHFDNDKALVLLRQYPDKIIQEVKGRESDLHENYLPVLEQAESQAERKRFFHWELEFPEVFIDLKHAEWLENGGFDVVIGNPPWAGVRGKHSPGIVDDLSMAYLEAEFPGNTYMPNAYEYFISKSLDILNKGGYNSFIVPDRLGYNSSLEYLRKQILNNFMLKELIYKLPFPGVIADTMIFIVSNNLTDNATIKVSEYKYSSIEIDVNFYKEVGDTAFIFFKNRKFLKTIEKIDSNSGNRNLGDILQSTSGFGGKSELITEKKVDKNQRMVYKGEDIGRYIINSNHFFEFNDDNITGRTRDENKLGQNPKVLLRKTGNPLFAALEQDGVYPEQSLYFIYGFKEDVSPEYITGLLNSTLFKFYYAVKLVTNRDSTPQLKNTHLDKFPVAPLDNLSINELEKYLLSKKGKALQLDFRSFSNASELIRDLVKEQIQNNKIQLEILKALDPFKFLNKGVAFKPFTSVFSEAIKYGEQLTEDTDISTVHHDIEGLRLQPVNPSDRSERSDGSAKHPWLLTLQLKHRDPETDWADWIKENGNIVRSTQSVYRFDLQEKQARYWQQAFGVLEEFENTSTFPGGKTRTTHEKLMKTKVPVFDDGANIDPLIELREELAEVEVKIEKTDWLIDQVVYQLYGLSEEEIETVEGSGKK